MDADEKSAKYGQPWTREELILAFDLYCRIPFQHTKANNPKVQELARCLGRTPASVARKLGNFGAFDPELSKKGISGLVHVSKLDREIWEEFKSDWDGLVLEAHRLHREYRKEHIPYEEFDQPEGPSEKIRLTQTRIHQDFFRQAVLSSYNETCCITGIRIPECLIASHIIPWSISDKKRTDPSNGLCLSATFDRLFDKGFMTITSEMRVLVSQRLLRLKDMPIQQHILAYHGQGIILPHRFLPSPESLAWHRENVFQDR